VIGSDCQIPNDKPAMPVAKQVSRLGPLTVFRGTVACRGVDLIWVQSVLEKLIRPLAEYVGDEVPLGIGVGEIL
jgi:hypothetical protein